jgi:hypothetical protein
MSLIHRLVVGHFDLSAGRKFVCTRPIDVGRTVQLLLASGAKEAADGSYVLDGESVYFRDGYVSFPWLSCRTNERAVAVAESLARDQDAILAEERIAGLWGPRGYIFYPPELATSSLR